LNELFFRVEKSSWQSKNPSAYYLDELVTFLSHKLDVDLNKHFTSNFLIPLNNICRQKYDQIRNSKPTEVEAIFKINIPLKILYACRPALDWYLKMFPDGDFIETAKDFIEAINKATFDVADVEIIGE